MIKKYILIIVVFLLVLPAFADKNSELFDAVERGDLEEVKELIRQGADVDLRDERGNTALIH